MISRASRTDSENPGRCGTDTVAINVIPTVRYNCRDDHALILPSIRS